MDMLQNMWSCGVDPGIKVTISSYLTKVVHRAAVPVSKLKVKLNRRVHPPPFRAFVQSIQPYSNSSTVQIQLLH